MSRYFLATTAMEEFWDTTKPMLFLGEWCLLNERKSSWKSLDGCLMESPFQSQDDAHNAYIHVEKIYEAILPNIADMLNDAHNTKKNIRYWRIIIGPWLHVYLTVVYDRFEHIMHALNEHPDLTTILLSKSSFIVPLNTLDFQRKISEDSYNLQIYSKILLFFGKKFPSKNFEIKSSSNYGDSTKWSWRRSLVSKYTSLCRFISLNFLSSSIVFNNSYFSRKTEFRLMLSSFGRYIFERGSENINLESRKYDASMREIFKKVSYKDDDFSKCLASMLFSDLPKCFVEDYQSIREIGKNKYSNTAKAIFSTNAWYYDEVFKYWAAECAEKATILLGTPHGGDYGALLDMNAARHEMSIVDYYYSWGWERESCFAKVVPMPASKLIGIKRIGANNKKSGILWATSSSPRYLSLSFVLPSLFHDYIQWTKRFAEALPRSLFPEILVRAHYQDFDWCLVSRLKESIPNLRLDSWDARFVDSMGRCRLYVCDHLGTTFAEALAANKPTILFWDPKENQLRPEAGQYFDLLRNSGILFDSPEGAAEAVRNVYDDVELWWNDKDRQTAVDIFCERYCRTSNDSIKLWINELHRVVDNAEAGKRV